MSDTKRRSWKRLVGWMMALLLLVGLGWWIIEWWRGPAIVISPETTFITEPLDANGNVDYAAALNEMASKGVTPENNAAVLIVQALGPECELSDEDGDYVRERVPDEFFDALALAPLPDEGDYYIDMVEFSRLRAEETGGDSDALFSVIFRQSIDAQLRPWSAEDRPLLADWLDRNEQPLRRVAEASRRSRFYMPLPGLSKRCVQVKYLAGLRDVTEAFRIRAMLRARQGDLNGACTDVLTCRRLGRLVRQRPMFITFNWVSMFLERLGAKTQTALAHYYDLSDNWLARLENACTDMPADRTTAHVLATNCRFESLALAIALAEGRDKALLAEMRRSNVREPGDWNEVLRQINVHFGHLVTAALRPDARRRTEELRRLDESIHPTTQSRSTLLHRLLRFVGINVTSQ